MSFARWLLGLCCAGWLVSAMAANDACGERDIVLVSGSHSSIQQLAPAEVRKLFLGFPVSQNGQRIEPLLNLHDPLLYEVFLQKVVFMSASNYERRVLARTFRQGDVGPLEFTKPEMLGEALRNKGAAVSFMWNRDVRGRSGLKVVQELCRSPVE